jgi:multiple sugar transport system ATP-binding protein
MTEIRFEKVTKKFGVLTVVRGLDLTVRDGEFFTFVGPSGCGKSTLLNMIAGLEPVSSGAISFDEAVVNDLSPKDRDVAMVFQSYALYPHLTVYENIAFPLRMKKERGDVIESEVRRIAALLGIADLLSRKPKELSGGQRQRVALGRAIIRRPKVFLMDEPLSNLDARLRIETRVELKRLHRELGITTVYVTHDQAEAMSLSDRIAVLDRGEIQQCDAPLEIYAKPANTFVAGFIGSPPMNFIRCSVKHPQPLEIVCNGTALSPASENPPRGDAVVVGVRPEDAPVSAERTAGSIEVTVSVTEPTGSVTWVDILWNGTRIKGTSRAGEPLRPEEKAYLTLLADRMHVFDAESRRRL